MNRLIENISSRNPLLVREVELLNTSVLQRRWKTFKRFLMTSSTKHLLLSSESQPSPCYTEDRLNPHKNPCNISVMQRGFFTSCPHETTLGKILLAQYVVLYTFYTSFSNL